jgi:hypothetical protein
MGRLSDPLWRRTIELFLLAGENGKTGQLPSVCEMAWILRVTEERMIEDLQALAQVSIVHNTATGWTVTNFATRQDADSDAERKQYQRQRERKVTHFPEPVTPSSPIVTKNVQELKLKIESELEEEGETASASPPQVPGTEQTFERIWQQVTGNPTFFGSTRIEDTRRIEAIFNRNEWNFDATVNELKLYFNAWINTTSPKTHKTYNRMNTGWLDWALAGAVNGNGSKEQTPMERAMAEMERISKLDL